MDYQKMIEEKKGLTENAGEAERQAAMERGIRLVVESQNNDEPRIHDMMKKSFVECNEKMGMLTLAYEVEEWELNPMDTMHGGLIAAAMDTTCGMAARYFSGCMKTPTITMTVNYLKPVPLGAKLFVTARAVRVGRHVANLTAEAVVITESRLQKEIAATGTAAFMLQK